MTKTIPYILLGLALCAFLCCDWCTSGSREASAQVSRPAPTATPKSDTNLAVVGLPKPSAAPTCGNTDAKLYGDPTGCVYACSDGRISILNGVTCAFPTPQATVTP